MNKKIFIKILILQLLLVSGFYFSSKLVVAMPSAPTVSSFSPVDNNTYVASSTDLIIAFSENIFVGSGNIYIKKAEDDSIFETIDVTSAQVTINGATTTINPSSLLGRGVAYYVQIDSTCFKNGGEDYYAGISDETTWGFIIINDLYRTVLVKDIHTDGNFYSLIMVQPEFIVMNDVLYFSASATGTHSNNPELWRTDGTTAGTALVKEIRSGTSGSYPYYFALFNNEIYFKANDGINGNELWKSDGTESGTTMVKDIDVSGNGFGDSGIVELNDEVYFYADDGSNGKELWKSDGTESGTVMVKDINGSGDSTPTGFVELNGELFFQANDGTNGIEPWKTDGTATGTVMVEDINSSGNSLSYGYSPRVVLGNNLYFSADDGSNGDELWKTDGTATGTVIVKDIYSSGSSDPYPLVAMNNELYFIASGTGGAELWKTDGTATGTIIVKDINTSDGAFDYYYDDYEEILFGVMNDELYFRADDGTNGSELWKTDGTATGTVMVKDINSSGSGVTWNEGRNIPFTVANNEIYFYGNDGIHGRELWKSDGTANGTIMVTDRNIVYNSLSSNFIEMNDDIYFAARDDTYGSELFRTYIVTTQIIISGSAADISTTTVILSGQIQSIGKENASERGFVWATSTNPTIDDFSWSETGSFSIGSFSATSTGLICANTYYFRAYSVNRAGTSYGDSISFNTDDCPLPVINDSMPQGAFLPPQEPTEKNEEGEGFKIIINNDEEETNKREVQLILISGSDTVNMAISERSDFTYASIEPYQENKEFVLSEGEGEKTIYVKFYTKWGQSSEAVSDSIVYKDIPGIDKEEEKEEISGDIKKESFFNIPKFLGRIIFQTGSRDKSWYVNPADQKRYSMENPFRMFNIMSYLSIGAVHEYINKYLEFPKRILGRILLDVGKNGEAYYINPIDKKKHYLGRPQDAFNMMKGFSIGISNNDIEKIEIGEIKIKD